ncbi:MAG: LysR substrate-binding domain-containing protein [Gammaproteobacteria bacterium]
MTISRSTIAPALFGRIYVTPIVTAYLQRYPEVRAECLFVDRIVNLVEEGIDVGIRIGELPDSSLQGIRVGTVRRVICAAPRYLRARGAPRHPEDLSRHTVISALAVTPVSQWRLSIDGKERLFEVTPRMVSSSNDAAIAAAMSGFGVVRLLSYQIAAHVKAGELTIVLADFEPAALPVHIVHHHGRRVAQKVRAFVDMTTETLRDDPSLTIR